jgi:tetratricopeptide (TPR) repeat protein
MSQYNARDLETAATSFAQVADQCGGKRTGVLSHFFLGKTRFAQRQLNEAKAAFDEYLRKADRNHPLRPAATIGVAMCFEGLQNFEAAAALLEQLSQTLDPKDPRYYEILFQAGTDFEKAGDRVKATEMYRQVSENATGPLKDRATVWVTLLE